MLARYKAGLIVLGVVIMSWVLITDSARIEQGERIEKLEMQLKKIEKIGVILRIQSEYIEVLRTQMNQIRPKR